MPSRSRGSSSEKVLVIVAWYPCDERASRVVRLRWKVSNNAAVAQRIRASVYGTEGREFESLQPHQLKANKDPDSGGPKCWCRHLSNVVIVLIAVLMTPIIASELRGERTT